MSRPSIPGAAPQQRKRLPRQRKSIRFDLRVEVYQKLLTLASLSGDPRPDPLIMVVERLILEAELPRMREKFVRSLTPLR